MGPMEIPWKNGKHKLNLWEWEREWEWRTGNGREMGIVVWKKFSLGALIITANKLVHWLAEQFAISS